MRHIAQSRKHGLQPPSHSGLGNFILLITASPALFLIRSPRKFPTSQRSILTSAISVCIGLGLSQDATAQGKPWAQFDLRCSGNRTSGNPKVFSSMETAPAVNTYRVDLEAKRFCSGACSQTSEIAGISETSITLDDIKSKPVLERFTQVNRESGRYIEIVTIGDTGSYMEGFCERQPFSGFPTRKF